MKVVRNTGVEVETKKAKNIDQEIVMKRRRRSIVSTTDAVLHQDLNHDPYVNEIVISEFESSDIS